MRKSQQLDAAIKNLANRLEFFQQFKSNPTLIVANKTQETRYKDLIKAVREVLMIHEMGEDYDSGIYRGDGYDLLAECHKQLFDVKGMQSATFYPQLTSAKVICRNGETRIFRFPMPKPADI